MRKTASIAGVLAAGAGMLTGTATAMADSTDNDGVNLGNDNELSALPIQLCGNNIAVLGAVVPILSPQDASCTNAPAVDHAQQDDEVDPGDGAEPGDEAEPQQPDEGRGGGDPVTDPEPTDPVGSGDTGSTGESRDGESLPTAPSPQLVQGHHAVTG